MPALVEAQQIASKAAGVGFDWDNVEQVFEKMHEELDELQRARESAGRPRKLRTNSATSCSCS